MTGYNLVDTSGWIEFFFDETNASIFSKAIEDVDHLVVPVICLYEVFKKTSQVAGENAALEAAAQMKRGRVVDLNYEIALSAARISLLRKLPMADSLIYATGQHENAIVWTEDEDFRDLPGVRFVERGKKRR